MSKTISELVKIEDNEYLWNTLELTLFNHNSLPAIPFSIKFDWNVYYPHGYGSYKLYECSMFDDPKKDLCILAKIKPKAGDVSISVMINTATKEWEYIFMEYISSSREYINEIRDAHNLWSALPGNKNADECDKLDDEMKFVMNEFTMNLAEWYFTDQFVKRHGTDQYVSSPLNAT